MGAPKNAEAVVHPVVLCGGTGSRLWPLSRSLHPKQLLSVARPETMLQSTVMRTNGPGFAPTIVLTGEDYRFMIKDQLDAVGATPETIILEPEPRNTAPAIALAAYLLLQGDPEALMLVMPSDHVIEDVPAFTRAVQTALPAAQAGRLVTFGIRPERPATGYGYIEASEDENGGPGVRDVVGFVEKPDADTAQKYCDSGSYYWNAGIFLFRAASFIDELKSFEPEIAAACELAIATAERDGVFLRPDGDAFLGARSKSIDYAVMERTDSACVVPVELGWSDVGSWDAVWQISAKDADGNAIRGEVVAIDTTNSLIRSEGEIAVAAVGVHDLVVVATRDAVLILPRQRAEDTRLIVDRLRERGDDKHVVHPRVHRPWGSYEVMDKGDRFQSKRLIVNAGQKLSLQMHHHRSEHWIVVRGTARVTIGENVSLIQENESTYIPAGTPHRLENPGMIPLHLIEVQCGAYLGEDDIVRISDEYGRLPRANPDV
jgi:mannose-1-phosphate guanylyltransferase/mannose-6-phosphate isomerase